LTHTSDTSATHFDQDRQDADLFTTILAIRVVRAL
jgi:hypothetical protein